MAPYYALREEEQREPAGTHSLSTLAAINNSMEEITLWDQPGEDVARGWPHYCPLLTSEMYFVPTLASSAEQALELCLSV